MEHLAELPGDARVLRRVLRRPADREFLRYAWRSRALVNLRQTRSLAVNNYALRATCRGPC